MMGFGMGFGFIGLLLMLLFWGGLIFLAVWLVRVIFSSNSNNNSFSPRSSNGENALEILAQRYARGEITREQYEIMKQDIS
jgi:putative membrane protein